MIAASLEQKVWVRTMGVPLYPNLFIGLVAPPGAGKTLPITFVIKLFGELKEHHTAPSSVTAAAITDVLNGAKRRIVRGASNPPYVEFNSLYVISREMSILFPGYDNEMMGVFNDIYDCGPYSQRRRGGDIRFEIENAQINLIAATTPSYLADFLPEGAWTQGFTSRTIFVYSGGSPPKDFFDDNLGNEVLLRELISDLKIIAEYYGKLEFTPEVVNTLRAWHMSGGPPVPEHPKLVHYNSRRTQHLLKLCQVAAVVRQDSTLTIDIEDYQLALGWLLEAEAFMPDIFAAMRVGGDPAVMEEVWHFVWTIATKEKKPIAEHRVIDFLRDRTPGHNVMKLLEVMTRSRLLIETKAMGDVFYSPAVRSGSRR